MSSSVDASGFENVLTPLTGGNLIDQFGQPATVDNKLAYYTIPPELAALGGNSSWNMVQWNQTVPMITSNYVANDIAMSDPVYGTPLVAWPNSGGAPNLAVYNSGTESAPDYVYSMTDGSVPTEGDLFLQSAQPRLVTSSLSKVTNIDITMKIPTVYMAPGTVSNFVLAVTMNTAGNSSLPASSGFLQIVPFSMRNSDFNFNTGTSAQYLTGYLNGYIQNISTGNRQFIYDANLNDPILPSINQDAGSQPIDLQYNINKYAQDLLDQFYGHLPASQAAFYENLANWTIGGVYAGPATYNIGGHPADNSKITTQLSNISLQVNPNESYSSVTASTGGETVPGPVIEFTEYGLITDTVEGTSVPVVGGGSYDRYLYTGANDRSRRASPLLQMWGQAA